MDHYRCYTCYTPTTRGERHVDVVEFSTKPCLARIINNIAIHQGSQVTDTSTENTGPKTPFTIREIQLQAIDRLLTLFNNVQPEKPQTKVVPS